MVSILLWFIGFIAFVAIITKLKTRNHKVEKSDDYFLGGRSLTGMVIASSLLLTNLSAVSFVGMASQAFNGNMSVMGWEVVSGVTLVLVAIFLLPRYLKQGITTIPEFIESRYDGTTRRIITFLYLISYVVNLLPITLYSGAIAMSQIFNIAGVFGISQVLAIWIMVFTIGIIGICYAVFGGLKAVAISDTINGVALLIGGLLVPIFGILMIGDGNFFEGFDAFINLTPDKFNGIGSSTDDLPFSTIFTGVLLVNLYYWGTDQSIIQRGLGAKNLKEGQKGFIIAGFLKVLTPIILIIPGVIAFQLLGEVSNSDEVYPLLVSKVLPIPLLGLFAAALMGAILSTFTGVLNSAATLFSMNVYKPSKFGEGKSDKDIIKAGKIFGLIVAACAMIGAPFIMYAPDGLFTYLQTINGFFNVPIFTIIFIGYVTKKVPPIAAKIGIIFFVSIYGFTQLVWDGGIHYLHISTGLFVITATIMYFIGKKWPNDNYKGIVENKAVEIAPWKHRYKASAIVIFAMVLTYIICSPIGIASEAGIRGITFIAIGINALVCVLGCVLLELKFNKKEETLEIVEAV